MLRSHPPLRCGRLYPILMTHNEPITIAELFSIMLPKKGVHLINDRTWPCISIYSRKYTCRKVFSLRSPGRGRGYSCQGWE